jgi:di/tripeptidase
VNVFAQQGIPSIVWSAGYVNPHSKDEHVALKDMITCTQLLLKTWEAFTI